MRNFLIGLIFVFFIFFFGTSVMAADSYIGPDGNTYEYRYLLDSNSSLGYNMYVYSHYPFGFCKYDPYGSAYRLVTVYEDNGNLYCGDITAEQNSYTGEIFSRYPLTGNPGSIQISKQNGDKPQFTWVLRQVPDGVLPVYDTFEDAYNGLTYVEKTYYYDASIPLPDFQVILEQAPRWSNVTEETNFFRLACENNNDYQVEFGYYYYSPSFVEIGLSNGNVTYKPITYYKSPYLQAYKGSAVQTSYYLNLPDVFEWDSYITTNSASYFSTSVPIWNNDFNMGAYSNARQDWIDKYSLVMPYYGNKIEILARYFIETSDSVYVSAWNRWINTYPSEYTAQIPSNYQVGSFVPGLQSSSDQIEEPEQEIIVGTITGSNNDGYSGTNITINQAVPNYPDYPTVASYNHDNILLQFMDTATKLPSTFSGFSSFLTSAFSFIPSSIWAVISFGLTCCIVVMIVKIL